MVARVWHGWTTPENASAYQQLLKSEILPAISARGIDGYRGATLLRRDHAGEAEFNTILEFDSIEDVRLFSGDDYEKAVIPAKAATLLKRYDERSQHYVILQHS